MAEVMNEEQKARLAALNESIDKLREIHPASRKMELIENEVTQEEFGAAVGVEQGTFNRWLTGERQANIWWQYRVLEQFYVDAHRQTKRERF